MQMSVGRVVPMFVSVCTNVSCMYVFMFVSMLFLCLHECPDVGFCIKLHLCLWLNMFVTFHVSLHLLFFDCVCVCVCVCVRERERERNIFKHPFHFSKLFHFPENQPQQFFGLRNNRCSIFKIRFFGGSLKK